MNARLFSLLALQTELGSARHWLAFFSPALIVAPPTSNTKGGRDTEEEEAEGILKLIHQNFVIGFRHGR